MIIYYYLFLLSRHDMYERHIQVLTNSNRTQN